MSEGPTLRQLRYFLRSVEAGSFSAAAAAEHVAQPSLSEQIRRLERNIGAQLFTRTNRTLQLTDVGRMIIPLARQTVRSADDLAATAREARTLTGGEVSFGTFSSAHRYLLTPLITEFRSLHPQVKVKIVGLNSSEVANAVRNGDLEAGLVQLPIDETRLAVSDPVLVDEVVYVSADANRTGQPISIEDLSRATLILSEARWQADDPLRRSIAARAEAASVDVAPTIEVEFQSAAMELAADGIGDTLVSYLVARSHESANKVTWVALDPPYEERFAFVTHASGSLSPATRQFMSLAHRHISALQSVASGWSGRRPTRTAANENGR
ncbi:LysR family transcriptional regulator [Rhodococcus sp. ACS1]|uniref:DNA-binding transcriptional regulator, LysR family n=1 Tax=Rhodococcus koreensis TaxID=99653 RepID=A0A1H4W278_9NOCA|nr:MULTISPECIES: LysR family transcriptional regulator [Rhodococcus]MDF3305127.1 LysR family transcriptional regulator [Rhodococcus sp. T2V]PBC49799.1 LysR family transcriptional regulator [Rhodococcus sp. ACS1]SEC87335.1 DNA-binding transcriptional regulator, LysR family [Rhodococcus koreensis]